MPNTETLEDISAVLKLQRTFCLQGENEMNEKEFLIVSFSNWAD